MQIKVDLKIMIVALLFFMTNQLEIYVILLAFAVLHECGHAIAGMCLGFKMRTITIMPFGVSISFKVTCEDYNQSCKKANRLAKKKLFVAMAGPLVNIGIVVAILLGNISTIAGIKSEIMIYANLLLAIINLVPIYPLDGGRIAKYLLQIFYGIEESYEYTNLISNVTICLLTAVASIAILYLKNVGIILFIAYLWYLVIQENKVFKNKKKMYSLLKKKNQESVLNERRESVEYIESSR